MFRKIKKCVIIKIVIFNLLRAPAGNAGTRGSYVRNQSGSFVRRVVIIHFVVHGFFVLAPVPGGAGVA